MPAYPTVRQVLFLCLVAAPLAQFALFPLVASLSPRLGLIAAHLGILVVLLSFVRFSHCRGEDVLLLNATHPGVLIATIPAAIGCALIAAELDFAVAHLLSQHELELPLSVQRTLIELQLVTTPAQGASTAVAVILLPGIVEELLFRGFAFTALYARYGALRALFGSSLIFAVVHLSPTQLPAHLLIGLFLGALAYWTHSVYPAIVAHMTNNLVSVVGVNVRTYAGTDVLGAGQPLPLGVLLAAFVLLWLGIRTLTRHQPIMPLIPPEYGMTPAGDDDRLSLPPK